MAAPDSSPLGKQLTCSICLDFFKSPITLTSCGHNFCKGCLEHFWDMIHIHSCPQCKGIFDPGLPLQENVDLNGLVEKWKEGLTESEELECKVGQETEVLEQSCQSEPKAKSEIGKECKQELTCKPVDTERKTTIENEQNDDIVTDPDEVACDSCIDKKLKAVKSCLTCMVSYCGSHLRPHLENTAFKNHKLIHPMKNIEQGKCCLHEQYLEFFCKNDQCCICMECTVEKHVNHEIISVARATTEKESELRETKINVDKKIKAVDTAIKKLQSNISCIFNSVSEVKSNVEKQFKDLMEAVQIAQREVLGFLDDSEQKSLKQASGIRAHLENNSIQLKKTKQEVEALIKLKNRVQFLQEFCEWNKSRPDDMLPSVYIGLIDKLSGISAAVSESTENIKQLLQTSYKEKLNAHSKEVQLGFKTTVAVICALKHARREKQPKTRNEFLKYAATLAFDLNTAHRYLRFINDNRKVSNTSPWLQPYPDHPKRFEHWRQVLCTESFYMGRCYWEVEISGEGTHVGMTYKSIDRKGDNSSGCITGNDFSWCIQWTGKEFLVWHGDVEMPGNNEKFSRIGVYLDYQNNILSFYGVDDAMTLIHKFESSFTEPLCPAFYLAKKEASVSLLLFDVEPAENTKAV
ncbi:tripartite motif-containing protein 16-like protein isoform X1 [Stegostoma tigrinum]|uniref:tripartite motif-containing protein 16-like protein isoform X1 n=1 Tax=Stegostoma tigrinum TaxID=3053191 RepID=UPI00286FBE0C|nr:tripartite motif-containing protein 16-like protein isoform X1 [Stegostoma tigrinum]